MELTKEQINKIGSIINKYDPFGLLKIGAPRNEYISEFRDIIFLSEIRNLLQSMKKNFMKK